MIASLALTFLIRALRLATDRYRPDEPNRARWYIDEIRDGWNRLAQMKVKMDILE